MNTPRDNARMEAAEQWERDLRAETRARCEAPEYAPPEKNAELLKVMKEIGSVFAKPVIDSEGDQERKAEARLRKREKNQQDNFHD